MNWFVREQRRELILARTAPAVKRPLPVAPRRRGSGHGCRLPSTVRDPAYVATGGGFFPAPRSLTVERIRASTSSHEHPFYGNF